MSDFCPECGYDYMGSPYSQDLQGFDWMVCTQCGYNLDGPENKTRALKSQISNLTVTGGEKFNGRNTRGSTAIHCSARRI